MMSRNVLISFMSAAIPKNCFRFIYGSVVCFDLLLINIYFINKVSLLKWQFIFLTAL